MCSRTTRAQESNDQSKWTLSSLVGLVDLLRSRIRERKFFLLPFPAPRGSSVSVTVQNTQHFCPVSHGNILMPVTSRICFKGVFQNRKGSFLQSKYLPFLFLFEKDGELQNQTLTCVLLYYILGLLFDSISEWVCVCVVINRAKGISNNV